MRLRIQDKAGDFRNAAAGETTRRLLSYVVGGYRLSFFFVLVCILLSAASGVAGSLFLKELIDEYIAPLLGVASPDFGKLFRAVVFMGLVYYAGVLATFAYNRLMITIGQGVQKQIRDQMFSHMQTLPVRYFDTTPYGDIMSRFTNDIDTLRQMISQSIPQMFSSLATIIGVFGAMLVLSPGLSLLVVAMVAVMTASARKVGAKSASYFIEQQNSLGRVDAYIEEMIQGQKVVKVFNHEEEVKKRFDLLNEELSGTTTSANRYANILMPIMVNLGNLQYALVAVIGGILAVGGGTELTVGTIVAFLQLSRTFTMPVSQLSQQLNSVIMALAGAERIFALIDEQPERDEGYVTLVNAEYEGEELKESEGHTGIWAWKHPHGDGSLTYTRLAGEVQFFDVDFGYDEKKMVLHNISIHAHPGEKVALVGATGAGKTTITNLLNRFYDVQDGKIRYDGININKIKKADLRRSLGMVLQDTHLFSGTIMENIRYGRLNATEDEIVAAAKLANADAFIAMLPESYETALTGDGGALSQGQRQLLSIARAAIADPPVMVLDEATSSIDTRTEAIVQRGMDSLMQGRTVFVIAHRLSTIKNADVIMVMEQGRIIERGNHEKLIAAGGKYYQLYTGAFELE